MSPHDLESEARTCRRRSSADILGTHVRFSEVRLPFSGYEDSQTLTGQLKITIGDPQAGTHFARSGRYTSPKEGTGTEYTMESPHAARNAAALLESMTFPQELSTTIN